MLVSPLLFPGVRRDATRRDAKRDVTNVHCFRCLSIPQVCEANRCKTLEVFDHCIFAFFAIEMIIKIIAMGLYGKDTYLAETWNRLDMFIVLSG